MNYQKISLDRTAALLVLLSVVCLPANAEDICSHGGKSKMLAANVTEAQIAIICPVIAEMQQDSPDQIKESRLARPPIAIKGARFTFL